MYVCLYVDAGCRIICFLYIIKRLYSSLLGLNIVAELCITEASGGKVLPDVGGLNIYLFIYLFIIPTLGYERVLFHM